MLKLKPEILTKNGRKEFVVLTYEEYESVREYLEDAQDVLTLRAAKAKDADAPTIPLAEAKRRLGLNRRRVASRRA